MKHISKFNVFDKTIKCQNCGWSWKLSEGGDDPYTCHKCGETNNNLSEGLFSWGKKKYNPILPPDYKNGLLFNEVSISSHPHKNQFEIFTKKEIEIIKSFISPYSDIKIIRNRQATTSDEQFDISHTTGIEFIINKGILSPFIEFSISKYVDEWYKATVYYKDAEGQRFYDAEKKYFICDSLQGLINLLDSYVS